MTENEFMARDCALLIEINEERQICINAERQILDANMRMQKLNKERLALRQEYARNKYPKGGQHHD